MQFPKGDGLYPKEFMVYYKFLWKIEELNHSFSSFEFIKEYWLRKATREFFMKNFPRLKLPETNKNYYLIFI